MRRPLGRLVSVLLVLSFSPLAAARSAPDDEEWDIEDDETIKHPRPPRKLDGPPREPAVRRHDYSDHDEDDGDRYNHLGNRWRLEGGIGARFGSFLVNGVDTTNVIKAGHLDGGFRNGRLLVATEYQLMSLQLPSRALDDSIAARAVLAIGSGRGLVHRVGAFARYSYGRVNESDAGIDLWVEGGVGVQHLRWDAGGTWTRPDFSFGLGTAGWGAGHHKHGGFSVGLRVTLAHREDNASAPVTCGGPCDTPTTPTGWDRSFLFDMTVMFGK